MAEESKQRVHILRLFGMEQAALVRILREAAAQGCPGLRLLEQGGEQAVCVRARSQSPEDLDLAAQWADELEKLLSAAFFGRDGLGLPQAAAQTMAQKEFLVVAVDEATGKLLGPVLASLPEGKAVYDFGSHSWGDAKKAARIAARAKGTGAESAARMGLEALRVSGADCALMAVPEQGENPAFALAVTPKIAWVRLLAKDDPAARNWLLDMARRMAAGLPPLPGTLHFTPGKTAPALPPRPPRHTPHPEEPAPSPLAADAPENAAGTEETTAPEAQGGEEPAAQPAPEAPQPEPAAPEGEWTAADAQAFEENAQPGSPQEERLRAALRLYGGEEETEPPAPYAAPKKSYRGRLAVCVAAVLVLCALAAGIAWWRANSGQGPSPKGYGTLSFDQAAQSYYSQAAGRDKRVAAYLALSGQKGTLVYDLEQDNAPGTVYAAQQEEETVTPGTRACLAAGSDLGSAFSNTLVWCPTQALAYLNQLDQQQVLAANYGFTLYTQEQTLRCKVAAVFYWDPEDDSFPLQQMQDLTNYRDYLTFVLGIKSRSLYDLPVDLQDTDRFVSLVAPTESGSGCLVVVGRALRSDESASVNTAAIAAAQSPLMPEGMTGAPDETGTSQRNQEWLGWVIASGESNGQIQEDVGMPEADLTLEQLQRVLDNLPDIQISPAYTASPDDPSAPDGSAAPDATLAPGTTATPAPTLAPGTTATPAPTLAPGTTATPAPAPTGAPSGGQATQAPQPTAAPASGRTINVTMNGTRQTMDLVECLAMICQNELGYGAPAEAIKAQAVAARSWALSQGGYPSVSGITPTQSTRNAVAQVADQVVVYGGSVAFTPYYASAAYGTCSSQDVWGGARPYLIAVDSPYDPTYATHWETVKSYPRADLAARVKERLGEDLEAYSDDPSDWIGDLSKNSSGYVLDMRVGNTHLSGSRFKQNVVNQLNGITLRSAAFDVVYDTGSDSFVFTVRGYGHGCGMSQFGAIGYASNGWSYADILAHYYPGTSLATY